MHRPTPYAKSNPVINCSAVPNDQIERTKQIDRGFANVAGERQSQSLSRIQRADEPVRGINTPAARAQGFELRRGAILDELQKANKAVDDLGLGFRNAKSEYDSFSRLTAKGLTDAMSGGSGQTAAKAAMDSMQSSLDAAKDNVSRLNNLLRETDLDAAAAARSMAMVAQAEQLGRLTDGIASTESAIARLQDELFILEQVAGGVPEAIAEGMLELQRLQDIGVPQHLLDDYANLLMMREQLKSQGAMDQIAQRQQMVDESDASALTRDAMSPLDRFRESVDKLERFKGMGMIDDRTFDFHRSKAQEDLDRDSGDDPFGDRLQTQQQQPRQEFQFVDQQQKDFLRLQSNNSPDASKQGDPQLKKTNELLRRIAQNTQPARGGGVKVRNFN